MILALQFLLAVAALILPGEALLRWLAPGSRWGWYRPWVAFGIGQGVATLCLWCLGMVGVPMWTWGIGIVLLGSLGLLWKSSSLTSATGDRRYRPAHEFACSGGLRPSVPMHMRVKHWASSLVSATGDRRYRPAYEFACSGGLRPSVPMHMRMKHWASSLASATGDRRYRQCFRGRNLVRIAVAGLPWVLLLFATWILCMQAMDGALKFRIGSIPGMGNWAYKTKLLMMTESWPADFFDYEAHNRRMGYPPGFPLLAGWCAAFMGGFETHAIRLLSVLLTVGAFLLAGCEMIRLRRWWGLPGVFALLALFLSYPGREIFSRFYAEPLLLYTAAVTIVALARAPGNPRCVVIGLLAAGCMAWTKNEGVVGFFLLAGCLFVFAKSEGTTRRAVVIASCCVAGAMILPWRAYLAAHGWSDESFAWESFVGDGRWERLGGAWDEYRKPMLQKGHLMGGAWWIVPMLAWFAFQRNKNAMLPTLLLVAVGWVAVAVVMMMGSAEEDFAWHVRAAPRVLLCPSFLLLMGYAHLGINQPNENHETPS